METNIQKWGNSLGVRLPSLLVKKKFLKAGTRVSVSETKTGIAFEVIKQPSVDIKQLLSKITPANLHSEADWGKKVGNELW